MNSMIELVAYVDGCCEPRNPGGTAAYGVIVKKGDAVLFQEGKIVGSGGNISNNVAEYSGLVSFLQWLIANKDKYGKWARVRSDSKLVVYQMSGEWRVKRGAYIPYYEP